MVQSIKNIIAVILLSVGVYLVWTTILPKYNHASALRAETEKRVNVLTKRQEILQMFNNLRDAYQERYAEFQRLSLVIPADKNLPEFISTIEDIASATGISITELKIEAGTGQELFNIIDFEVNANASYDAIFSFLSFLEQNIRLMDVNSISIGSAPGQTNFDTLTFQIRAKTYYINPSVESVDQGSVPVSEF